VKGRRDFFKSLVTPLQRTSQEKTLLLVRPPYGKNESLFQSKCPTCEDKRCVTSCDEKIIFVFEDGTPSLNFNQSGCTLCDDCAIACPENVLSLEHLHTQEKINAIFKIDYDACVAHQNVICFSCKEPCVDDAILFNGMFNPVIDNERCTGCGFCLSRCPTSAIVYNAIELEKNEEDVS